MTKPLDDYGLLLDRTTRHGTDYVELTVVRRQRHSGSRRGGPTRSTTKLSFRALAKETSRSPGSRASSFWMRLFTRLEGRNRYRALIEEVSEAARARKKERA